MPPVLACHYPVNGLLRHAVFFSDGLVRVIARAVQGHDLPYLSFGQLVGPVLNARRHASVAAPKHVERVQLVAAWRAPFEIARPIVNLVSVLVIYLRQQARVIQKRLGHEAVDISRSPPLVCENNHFLVSVTSNAGLKRCAGDSTSGASWKSAHPSPIADLIARSGDGPPLLIHRPQHATDSPATTERR